MPRFLSKSSFKVALECPRKLMYLGNDAYVNNKKNNEFLKSLAEGGFQVGEMAKLLYPGGTEVQDERQADQIAHTRALLNQDNVTIYEATLQYGHWVARVDVLRKQGNRVELIEVKSKSFDSLKGTAREQWRTAGRGQQKPGIESTILPYLQDVAFQTMLAREVYPEWTIVPYLMVVDKAQKATVDGLNQMFKIRSIETGARKRIFSEPQPGVTRDSLGHPMLIAIDVSEFVDEIIQGTIKTPEGEKFFRSAATEWAEKYSNNVTLKPVIGSQCRACEFVTSEPDEHHRSGFHECWSKATGLPVDDIDSKRPITRLYHPVRGEMDGYFSKRVYWMDEIDASTFEVDHADAGMSRKARQHMQIFGQWGDHKPFAFDAQRWRDISRDFVYPLHFIDFEGCRPVLPFLAGKHPYGQIAFQFSHHMMHADGSVEHANEFIDLTPGNDPSIEFVRHLRNALCAPGVEKGTVFMWSSYENTMLNGLRDELLDLKATGKAPADVDELIAFLELMTIRKIGKNQEIKGDRAMVDLYKIALACFFHPDTEGRASIKVVLPAVLKSSDVLRRKYAQPIYGAAGGIPSKNFPFDGSAGMVWWVPESDDGARQEGADQGDAHEGDNQEGAHASISVKDPYHLLPPLFADFTQEDLESIEQGDDGSIREGGAATTAYCRMQFEDVPDAVREATRKALLRYCELDTLAMVMIFEAWEGWARNER